MLVFLNQVTNHHELQQIIWKWYDMIWYDNDKIMIWYDMTWYDDMIWNDMIWNDMIWYDMIWYDMIWYMMCCIDVRCDIVWYDYIWYDMRPWYVEVSWEHDEARRDKMMILMTIMFCIEPQIEEYGTSVNNTSILNPKVFSLCNNLMVQYF